MRLYTLCCIVLLCCIHSAQSQRQDYNWHFGAGAGISWSSGTPTVVNSTFMSSNEGCAAISERSTGKLLFYTNGRYVWDSTHIPLSKILNSGPSSTQGPFIIPDPNDPDQYYVFAVPDLTGSGPSENFCYSLVRTKPELEILIENKFIRNEVAEKITVAYHQKKYWIIVHNRYSSAFYSYLLDDEGFHTTPVVSDYSYSTIDNVIGCMKVSPDGTMLALATYGGELRKFNSHLLLFNFDKVSGLVYNRKLIKVTDTLNYVYGVAFSPDSKKLYATGGRRPKSSGDVPKIYQYEIAADQSIVSGSEYIIYPASAAYGMQLGPDDKLYVSRDEARYLSVINFPNNKGSGCDYVDDAIALIPGRCALGLPNFSDKIFSSDIEHEICEGENVEIGMEPANNVYRWSPTTGLSDPTIANPIASPTNTTVYTLSVTNSFGKVSHHIHTVTVAKDRPQLHVFPSDPSICKGKDTVIFVSGGKRYHWSPAYGISDTLSPFPVVSPDTTTTYTVRVFNGGCFSDIQVKVTVVPISVANAGADKTLCKGGSTKIGSPDSNNEITYSWLPIEGLDNPFISNPTASPLNTTQYIITAKSKLGCITKDTCFVNIVSFPFTVRESDTICYGDAKQLIATGGSRYEWSPKDGLSNHEIATPVAQPHKTTRYRVLIYQSGCVDSAFVTITVNDFGKQSTISNYVICEGASIKVGTKNNPAWTYKWNPATYLNNANSAQPICSAPSDMRYIVTITNEQGCIAYDTVYVKVGTTLLVHAGEDIVLCSGSSVQLSASGAEKYLWLPADGLDNANISNPIANPQKTTTYIVKGISVKCFGEDTITVIVNDKPIIAISADTTICEGNVVQLSASGADEYIWSPSAGISDSAAANPVAKPLATTKYYVRAKKGECTVKDSVTITVINIPLLSVLSDTTICAGNSVQLTASGAENYSWSPGTGLNNPDIPNPIATPTETITYTVIGKNGNCSESKQITIQVTPQPLLTVNNDVTIFTGDKVQLLANGAEQYTWSPTDGLDNANIPNPIATPTETITYTVTGKNGNCEQQKSVTITVKERGERILTVSKDTVICKGDSVRLFADGYETYIWSPKEGLNTETSASPLAFPAQSTWYKVQGFADNKTDSAFVMVQVKESDTVMYSLSLADNKEIHIGNNVSIRLEIKNIVPYSECTLLYDDCCLFISEIPQSKEILVSVLEKGNGFIRLALIKDKETNGTVTVAGLILLPEQYHEKQTITVKDIKKESDKCTVTMSNNVDLLYSNYCAYMLRGVKAYDKFDIISDEKQTILYTGVGGYTEIAIYDMKGEEMWKKHDVYPASTEQYIQLPELSGGVYILRASNYVWKKDVVMFR